ncbi:MAG: MFS transporter [Tatlockia sp.]|nr:MFS transporter [Tatlockia sp.]
MANPLINISRKQAYTFASFLVLYEFLTYIANDMIMPGMLKVVESFHGPESAIATSLIAYILGGASLQLFLGPLSDRYGRRPVMLAGALLFFLCTILIACSNSIEQFLVARFFQGMGLCFIGVIGYATLQEIFAEMDAIRIISIMANVSTIAPLLGPLLGAIFIQYFNWRYIFVLIGLFALAALWGLWRYMPEPVGQIKLDGQEIKRFAITPRVVASNYKNLVKNPSFILGSIALGFIIIPCVAWIALAPIILINEAKLSVIEYGLWQLPIFGSTLGGTWLLRRMTHKGSLKNILLKGSIFLTIGLLLCLILPLVAGNYFIWLMPGLIIYFFGLGIMGGPINRYILYSTEIGKGTAAALMSMVSMSIQGLGVEVANYFYKTHSNVSFGFYCTFLVCAYLIFLYYSLRFSKDFN